jgi:hypothetical protein
MRRAETSREPPIRSSLVLNRYVQFWAEYTEKVTATFCARHPKGLSGKRWLSPFRATIIMEGVEQLIDVREQALQHPDRRSVATATVFASTYAPRRSESMNSVNESLR